MCKSACYVPRGTKINWTNLLLSESPCSRKEGRECTWVRTGSRETTLESLGREGAGWLRSHLQSRAADLGLRWSQTERCGHPLLRSVPSSFFLFRIFSLYFDRSHFSLSSFSEPFLLPYPSVIQVHSKWQIQNSTQEIWLQSLSTYFVILSASQGFRNKN